MKNELTPSELQAATEAAADFIGQYGEFGLSPDIIVLMCFVKQQQIGTVHPRQPAAASSEAIPEWFTSGVKRFAGRKLTASAILTGLGRATDIKSLREAGGWLRQLYGEPSRSGGQTLFFVSQHVTGAIAQAINDEEDDRENPYDARIPIGSRALNFAAKNRTQRYKPEDIARLVGGTGSQDEINEIGKALYEFGFQYSDGYYDLRFVRTS